MIQTGRNPFVDLEADGELSLPGCERFAEAGHVWSQPEIDALIVAWAAGRPLLIRGEAGSGKSQIARAAAQVLGSGSPIVEVIHPRFEAQDLMFVVDAVARLADAHAPDTLDRSGERYVRRGPLWRAMDAARESPSVPVLLIDEVDKADSDLPNALLEVLGNRSFPVPPLGGRIVRAAAGRHPLIIFTTNEERELPAAFIRRCIVLNVSPPEEDGAFITWLVERGRVHRALSVTDGVRTHTALQVLDDRKDASRRGFPKVGLAEYIDLLTAVNELTLTQAPPQREVAQLEWVQRLSAYALVKNPGQKQQRAGRVIEGRVAT